MRRVAPAQDGPTAPLRVYRASAWLSGAQEESSRPHALDIYERICEDTAEELSRPQGSLFYSALFAGFTIGLSALAVALTTVSLTPEVQSTAFIAALLYPIGYVAVIIGRSQFFTENTLYPVMLSMRKPEYLNRTARLWAIVFSMNLVGAFIFAMLAVLTGALAEPVQAELVSNGVEVHGGLLHRHVLERGRSSASCSRRSPGSSRAATP